MFKTQQKQLVKLQGIMRRASSSFFEPKLTAAGIGATFAVPIYGFVFFQLVGSAYYSPKLWLGFVIAFFVGGIVGFTCEKHSTWEQKMYHLLSAYVPANAVEFERLKESTRARGTLSLQDLEDWMGFEQQAIATARSIPAKGSETEKARDSFLQQH